jgi:CRISPR/Cas system CMR subunit Cmr6 (Cas7 group RAMP superfamily)
MDYGLHGAELPVDAESRHAWFHAIAGSAEKPLCAPGGLYPTAYGERERLLRSLPLAVEAWKMDVVQLVQTGTGDAHIAGFSLRLNDYGAPVIDGATLRGLLAASTGELRCSDGTLLFTEDDRLILLGRGGRQARAGIVTVFEAWWWPGSGVGPFGAEVDGPHAGPPIDIERYEHAHGMKQPKAFPQMMVTGTFGFYVGSEDAGAARLIRGVLQRALEERGVGRGVHNDDYGRFRSSA